MIDSAVTDLPDPDSHHPESLAATDAEADAVYCPDHAPIRDEMGFRSRTSRTTSSRAALGPNPAAVVIGCNALAMSVSLASESVP